MKKIILYGPGEGTIETLKIIIEGINKKSMEWNVIGFIDKDNSRKDQLCCGYPILGEKYIGNKENLYGICGIMDNRIRKKIINEEILGSDIKLASLIHPLANIHDSFKYGTGSVIYPNVNISYDVSIGTGSIVNYNSLLGHGFVGGEFIFIGPSVTFPGRCKIGNSCLIGAGSSFIPGINVGENSLIGAGSTIFTNVEPNSAITDMPRKIIRKKPTA